MSARLRESKATTAKHAELLRAMLKRPENKVCVDCKRNDPRWASTNLGIFLCIRCSGIHRGLGVHISRVRSVDLDTWSPEQIAVMDRWGNKKANIYWEAHLKPGHQPPEHKMEQFIRSKYESKRWAMEGPLPDPSTLTDANEPALASPPALSQAAAAKNQQQPAATDLLGGGSFSTSKTLSAPPKATVSLSSPSPPSARIDTASREPNVNSLFDLDFSPSATSAATSAVNVANSRRNNADILSLFGGGGPPTQVIMQQQQQQTNQPSSFSSGLDAFSSLHLGASAAAPNFLSTSSYSQQPQPAITSNAMPPYNNSSSSAQMGATRAASNSISGNPWAASAMPSAVVVPTSSNNVFSPPISATTSVSSTPSYAVYASHPSTSNNFASSPTQQPSHTNLDLFNSADIWGNSTDASSNAGKISNTDGGFGGFSSAGTAGSSGGFNNDLWG